MGSRRRPAQLNTGERKAISTKAINMKSPIHVMIPASVRRFWTIGPRIRPKRVCGPSRDSHVTSFAGDRVSVAMSVSNPWVDDAINDVDRHRDQDDDERVHDDRPLDHGVVLRIDRIQEEGADAVPRERPLRDDGAAEEDCKLEPQDGHHRNQRVPECVPVDDRLAANAPRPRSLREVGVDRQEEVRAYGLCEESTEIETERKTGEDEMLDRVHEIRPASGENRIDSEKTCSVRRWG